MTDAGDRGGLPASRAIAEANGAEEVIAPGTSAIREALDGGLLVDRVRVETGVKIVVVDGTREAEPSSGRSVERPIDPGPALAADLGGGSLDRGGDGPTRLRDERPSRRGRLTAESWPTTRRATRT